MDMPAELGPFSTAIEATRKPIIAIRVERRAPVDAVASRLGGYPWWPAARAYPLDDRGRPLLLLAQINLAEAPRLDPFPNMGLLQFLIGTDDLMGANFDALTKPHGFVCAYHIDVQQERRDDFSFLQFGVNDYSPLQKPLTARALTFGLASMAIDPRDYRFAGLLPDVAEDERLLDLYLDAFPAPFMRMGGYPTFTQEDPRAYAPHKNIGDVCLLTVDTWEGIMWGDSGVAQFFVREEDLIARDFSRVVYNWDCL